MEVYPQMDMSEAVNKRQSIRAFKHDPVPQDVLRKILEAAIRAPSWANTQPWEFVIATGAPLEAIKAGFLARGLASRAPDVAPPPHFPEKYAARIRELDRLNRLSTKEDRALRRVQNYRLFGAPAVTYLVLDREFYYQAKGINVWALYDCGALVENLMLLAVKYRLGTIALAEAVVYPDILRKVLEIPESKIFVLGIAIGYPDWDNPLNQFRTAREPLDSIVKWAGFE